MGTSIARTGTLIGIVLIATIVTQIFYMASLGGPSPSDPAAGVTNADTVRYFEQRWPEIASVWMTELIAFVLLFIAASTLLARQATAPFAWATLALSALANIFQIAMGLSMFRPAAAAGPEFDGMSTMIVEGAFFFYFLAKLLLGAAGAGFGLTLIQRATGRSRMIGFAALAVGLVAAAANFAALPQGLAFVLPAGATGTLAALTTGFAASAVAQLADARPN